jgi:hypothetical protein
LDSFALLGPPAGPAFGVDVAFFFAAVAFVGDLAVEFAALFS